jgi:hypothetical protein
MLSNPDAEHPLTPESVLSQCPPFVAGLLHRDRKPNP